MKKQLHNFDNIKKILILRCEGALGDAVISSFVFREIKRQFPKIKIGAAAFGPCAEYYSKNKYIDNLYYLPIKSKIRAHQHWPELMYSAFKIRLEKYDLVVDSSDKNSINWTAFKWLCSKKEGLYDIKHNSGKFGDYTKHRSEHERLVFENLGLKVLDTNYDIYSTPESEKSFLEWKKENKLNEFICINAFGSIKERTFNKATIEAVISCFPDNKKFVVPCMPSQISHATKLIPKKFKKSCFLFETKDVFALIALIKESSFVTTPDTAAVHIASGCQKPTVAFYNNYTNYYSPANNLSKIIKAAKGDVNEFQLSDLQTAIKELMQS